MAALYVYILTPVLLAIILNIIIFKKNWNNSKSTAPGNSQNRQMLPTGIIIGLIWVILLGILGNALFRATSTVSTWAITALIAMCLLYPVLTRLNDNIHLFNRIVLIIAFTVAIIVQKDHCKGTTRSLVWYLVPVIAWLSYINIIDSIMTDEAFVVSSATSITETITETTSDIELTPALQRHLRQQWMTTVPQRERDFMAGIVCNACAPAGREESGQRQCNNDWDCDWDYACRVQATGALSSSKFCVADFEL